MYYFIVNPAAGGARINKIQDRLVDRLKKLGIYGEFVKSTGADDVGKLARLGVKRGFKTIVAVGGDGTINEVMNAILDFDKVVLGIIPTGTTNDLADSLGIKDWYEATNILASRKVAEINLGQVGDRYFVTNVTVGFDPKIAKLKQLSKGNIPDKLKYAFGIFGQASTYKPISTDILFDSHYEVSAECFNVVISSGFKVIGEKSSEHPLLDTLIVTKIPGAKALKYGYKSNLGHIENSNLSSFHSKKVEISTKKPTEVTADGQHVGLTPVVVRSTDKKLRVIISRRRQA